MRKQALEALRKLRTEKMAEVKEFKLRLDHLRTHKDTAARLRKDIDGGECQEAGLSSTISDIDGKLAEINQVGCRVLCLLCRLIAMPLTSDLSLCTPFLMRPSQSTHTLLVL